MTWALKFAGASEYALFSTVTLPSDFTVIIDCVSLGVTISGAIIGENSDPGFSWYGDPLTVNKFEFETNNRGSLRAPIYYTPTVNQQIQITLDCTGLTKTQTLDGIVNSDFNTKVGNVVYEFFGKTQNGFNANIAIIRCQILDNGVLIHDWDATASSHVPGTPVLLDTISGNNATGSVTMPTDGSAWINLGGATNNFSGTGAISVNNSIVSTGEKSILQQMTLNANVVLTETGIKSASSSAAINSTNTVNSTGYKYSESAAQINVNTSTLTNGYKSASASASISVVNTFSVTGTAANIISKSGTGSITATTTINSTGVKYANGTSSISVLAAIVFAGYKTASSVITDACFNTFSSAGYKSSSSSVSFSSNTTFTVLGYSNAFTPILRSVTINGVMNNSTIPGQINNSISIKGVI